MLEHTDEAIANLAEGLGRLAEKHGGQGIEAALYATQLEAMRSIIVGGLWFTVWLAGAIALLYVARGIYHQAERNEAGAIVDGDPIVGMVLLSIAGFGCLASGFAILTSYASPLYWAAALGSPEVLLAHRIIEEALR